MPIYHDCAQYGEVYERLKIGIPTSSGFAKILTPIERKKSGQWNEYKFDLIGERLKGYRTSTFASPAMELGLIREAEAADWYVFSHDVDVRRVGFVTDDDNRMACSPDRLVGEDGLLEIKCPDKPGQQVAYHLQRNSLKKFWSQLQGQLLVTQRKWVDIVAWHDGLPTKILRVTRDEPFIELLAAWLDKFIAEVEAGTEEMRTGDYVHAPEAKAALKDMLRASLEAVP
jgi:hypothetical protein